MNNRMTRMKKRPEPGGGRHRLSSLGCWSLLFCVVCIFLALLANDAQARKRALFIIGNFRHWTDLTYEYSGYSTVNDYAKDRTSRSQQFEEDYTFAFNYAILSHKLLNGRAEFTLGAEQAFKNNGGAGRDADSSGLNFEYAVEGVAFQFRPYPITFSSNMFTEQVNNPYSEHYVLTQENHSIGIAMENDLLPSWLNYRVSEDSTDGLISDRTNRYETVTFNSVHRFRGISTTDFSAYRSTQENDFQGSAQDIHTDSHFITLSNSLTWGKPLQRRYVDSTYQVRQESGSRNTNYDSWSESVRIHLGKALEYGLNTDYQKETSDFQTRRRRLGRTFLEHRLFNSLTTRLEYLKELNEYSTGDDNQWNRQISFSYGKALPRQCRLNLGYSNSYGETDRNLKDENLFITGELLTVKIIDNYLQNTNVVQESVAVLNADRTVTYLEGVDYELREFGRLTEIVPLSGLIQEGDVLSIDYSYRVNDSIEYSTLTNSVSGSLQLFDNRYRIFTTLTKTDRDLISGSDTVQPLVQLKAAVLGFEANIAPFTYGSVYSYVDSTLAKDEALEGYLYYLRSVGRRRLSVRLNDRYSVTEQKELLTSGSMEESKNVITLRVNYQRPWYRRSLLTLRGEYRNLRGSSRDEDDLTFGATLEAKINKFEFRLLSEVQWKFFEDSRQREDYLRIEVRRYF